MNTLDITNFLEKCFISFLFKVSKSLFFSQKSSFLAELIIKNNRLSFVIYRRRLCVSTGDIRLYKNPLLRNKMAHVFTAPSDRFMFRVMHFIIFTLSVFAFFSCPHVGRPTIGTKSFDSASNSILSDGPTGYMTNRSSCLKSKENPASQPVLKYVH